MREHIKLNRQNLKRFQKGGYPDDLIESIFPEDVVNAVKKAQKR